MASPSQQDTCEESPMRITRIREKEQLQSLNDRLMSYISQVRTMKETNYRLENELMVCKEQLGREADSVKHLYEAELADARNLIDETAKEKARQQIMASKSATRIEELEAELKELKEALERAEARLVAAERNAASLDAERKSALVEKGRLSKQVRELEAELEELRSTMEALKATLEAETLSKVDLQNHIQSLKEEMAFMKKVHSEEVASLRLKLHELNTEHTDFDVSLQTRKFEDAIDELREKSEMELAQYKAEMDLSYKERIIALETQSTRDVSTITRLNNEIRKISATVGGSNAELSRLQKAIEKLECALRDKDGEIARIRQGHTDEVTRLLDELRELRSNYEIKIHEYEELMDIKINLDQEIATYRALLHEEETRLNLTPTPREKRTRTHSSAYKAPSPKKARFDSVKSSATGCVQISDVDPDGRFVQIKNFSNQVESLGGFKIVHKSEGEDDLVFRFHHKSKLQGGASVTIWASKAEGATHNPPGEIIWRNLGKWCFGDKTTTELIGSSGQIMATFVQRSSPSKTLSIETPSFETVGSAATSSFPHILQGTAPLVLEGTEQEGDEAGTSYTTTTTTITTTRNLIPEPEQVGEEHMFHQKGDPRPKGPCRVS